MSLKSFMSSGLSKNENDITPPMSYAKLVKSNGR
jgi:hypothetical protein